MLCAAESDPFQGQHYRIAAVIHEGILCPILNKFTVYMFAKPESIQVYDKSKSSAFSKPTTNVRHQGEGENSRESKQHQLYDQQPAYSEPIAPLSASLASSTVPYDNQYTQQQQRHYTSPSTYSHSTTSSPHVEDAILVQRKVNRNLIDNPSVNQSPLAVPLNESDDYILEQDDIEVVDSMTTKTITAEYTMPTTKID